MNSIYPIIQIKDKEKTQIGGFLNNTCWHKQIKEPKSQHFLKQPYGAEPMSTLTMVLVAYNSSGVYFYISTGAKGKIQIGEFRQSWAGVLQYDTISCSFFPPNQKEPIWFAVCPAGGTAFSLPGGQHNHWPPGYKRIATSGLLNSLCHGKQ
ncbi:MAG: hypothetical protein NTV62_03725 [Candidatus Gribaldobacteria bacterium]|nr:hypothetical protein [Candidatus Gribaldobacteria bacterium]